MLKTLMHILHQDVVTWDSIVYEHGEVSHHQELIVNDEIGQGTFGKIFRGEYHLHYDNSEDVVPVAIKKTRLKKITSSNELRNLVELKDEREIIHLYNYAERHSEQIFVIELCNGSDLMNFILENKERDPGFIMNERDAASIIRWLLIAIQTCHNHGIIHNDIKPENIGLKEKGDVSALRLLDFGNSKLLGREYCTTDLYGSPRYVAPELRAMSHMRDDEQLKSIDVWCVGVVAFVLAESKYPTRDLSFARARANLRRFIEGILTPYPKRLTIDQCLSHEWLNRFE